MEDDDWLVNKLKGTTTSVLDTILTLEGFKLGLRGDTFQSKGKAEHTILYLITLHLVLGHYLQFWYLSS